jgi:CYTH domain-containing protein/MOSC domain-containing protein YiiM
MMAIEIERRFIVIGDGWRRNVGSSQVLRQGYLADGARASIRVRMSSSGVAALTIKSSGAHLERQEYEYPVPIADAEQLLRLCEGRPIDKIRHCVAHGGLTWEVDVFEGENGGLVIAEVELEGVDQNLEKPQWIGTEVTGDSRLSNVQLSKRPFLSWGSAERSEVTGRQNSLPGGRHGHVVATCRSSTHGFSKPPVAEIQLLTARGVAGDAHMGATVKHRSRVRHDPSQPNLRQVHLLQAEFLDEARQRGFVVAPGELGENITTRGLALLELPRGTLLRLGSQAVLRLTGLRNPCHQIDDFRKGLLAVALDRDSDGGVVRRTGVMAVVVADGAVRATDEIVAELPALPHEPLEPV